MNNRIDTEELLTQLFEKGIDADISISQTNIVVQLDNIKDGIVIGIASGNNVEQALSTIIRNLAEDSQKYKEMNALTDSDMLSTL